MKINEVLKPKKHNERENMLLHEALVLSRDVTDDDDGKEQHDVLVVTSDAISMKDQSSETFKHKNALKKAGFVWKKTGKRWVIDSDKFDIADKTISAINGIDYIMRKVEDVEEFVGNSFKDSDRKKDLEAKLDKYIKELANATDEQAANDEIRKYLEFFSGFHNYSFNNTMLILIQKPDATKVASKTFWRTKKRYPSGPAIYLYRPDKRVWWDEPEEEGGEKVRHEYVRDFVPFPAYDISDTSPMKGGEVPDEPQWYDDNTPSKIADELYDFTVQAAQSEGIDITNGDARHGEKGFSAGGHINITSSVKGVARAATMVHEYAHELMHWEDSSKFYVGPGARHKPTAELQAEAVSFITMRKFGLPCEHQAKYMALWSADRKKVHENFGVVTRVAKHIINNIDEIANK